jgi:hypothetical protein
MVDTILKKKPTSDLQDDFYYRIRKLAIALGDPVDDFAGISSASFTEALLEYENHVDPDIAQGGEGKLKAGRLLRVMVEQTAGDATSFDVEIRTKPGGTGIDVIYDASGAITKHDVVLVKESPFVSEGADEDDEGFIWLAIKPNGGSSGTYKAKLFVEPWAYQ